MVPVPRQTLAPAQRHLAVVYAFYGIDETTQPAYRNNPNGRTGPIWEQIYRSIVDELKVRFVVQATVDQLLNGIDWNDAMTGWAMPFSQIVFDANGDRIEVDFNSLIGSLVERAPTDAAAASTYYDQVLSVVKAMRLDLFGNDSGALAGAFGFAATKAGMPTATLQGFLAGLGYGLIDEGATTGNITNTATKVVILLGTGDKALSGGQNVTYVYSSQGGTDVVQPADTTSELMLADLSSTSVTIDRPNNGNDLVLINTATGARLTIANHFNGSTLQRITFADAVSWSSADVNARLLSQAGTSGNDMIVGFGTDDALQGNLGNDNLQGGSGSDTYTYNRGDGSDAIVELVYGGNADRLVLKGIAPSDVTLARSGTDVTITIAPSMPGGTDGGSILLKTETEEYYDQGVDLITFDNGTTWTRATLRSMILAASTSGNDTITGFGTNDTLQGGLGNDTLQGAAGNDTYIYNRGDGADSITEGYTNGNADNLVLHGINPAEVSLLRNGSDVTLVIAPSTPGGSDGGSILLKTETEEYYDQGVDLITFDNGTTWTRSTLRSMLLASTSGNDTITGFGTNDTLQGGLGNDTLQGGAGNDTYLYSRGDGNDTIVDPAVWGTADKLTLQGITPDDALLVRSGTDILVTVAPSSAGGPDGGSVLLKSQINDANQQGIEQIAFGNGVTWNNAQIKAAAGYQAGPGGVTLQAPNGGAVLISGTGNDTLLGGNGADTFMMPAGAGNDTVTASLGNGADTLRFDRWTAHDQLWFAQSSNNLVVSVIGLNQSVTVSNWYGAANNHLGKVLAGDGYTVTDAGIQQLVEAMASFTPPPAGQTTLPPELAASLSSTLAANWQHQ